MFVAIAAAIVAFLASFSATRKAHVAGILLPTQGLIRILSSQAGTVTQSRVTEGQSVKAGDVLFALTSERSSATKGDADSAVTRLLEARRDSLSAEGAQQSAQGRQRIDAARRRAEALQTESQRIDEQIALQERRVALADEALKRYSELQAANFISAAGAQDKQAEMLDQRQRLAELRRAKAGNARDQSAVQAELRDLEIQAQRDRAVTERAIASIEQELTENEARREVLVRAPHDGTVSAITSGLGQVVGAGQTLAALLPVDARIEAELYAPSRAAGFVKPGMSVLIRYQAYPYQKFGQSRGVVREVSSSAMQASDLPMSGATGSLAGGVSEPLYRVRVSLDRQSVAAYGVEHPLRAGMAVDASVLLDRRRLYEWILEPLYSITGRV